MTRAANCNITPRFCKRDDNLQKLRRKFVEAAGPICINRMRLLNRDGATSFQPIANQGWRNEARPKTSAASENFIDQTPSAELPVRVTPNFVNPPTKATELLIIDAVFT